VVEELIKEPPDWIGQRLIPVKGIVREHGYLAVTVT
jgi:hypothetical protein